jgi:K(+)-stimulated pyrophosphate-energized sodium pump
MAADLFETYAVTAVAAMLLGHLLFPKTLMATEFPLVLGAVSIIASMIAIFFVRLGKSEYIMGALYKGMFGAAILAAIAFYYITNKLMTGLGEISAMSIYYSTLVGLVLTVVIVIITEYYTGKYGPVKGIADHPPPDTAPISLPALPSACSPPQPRFWPSASPFLCHIIWQGFTALPWLPCPCCL